MARRTAAGVAWRPPLADLIDGLARGGDLQLAGPRRVSMALGDG
jgi:hypothetical protein